MSRWLARGLSPGHSHAWLCCLVLLFALTPASVRAQNELPVGVLESLLLQEDVVPAENMPPMNEGDGDDDGVDCSIDISPPLLQLTTFDDLAFSNPFGRFLASGIQFAATADKGLLSCGIAAARGRSDLPLLLSRLTIIGNTGLPTPSVTGTYAQDTGAPGICAFFFPSPCFATGQVLYVAAPISGSGDVTAKVGGILLTVFPVSGSR